MGLNLYVANKNYSSWSMRGWLVVKASGVTFSEHTIPLAQENTIFQIRSRSPSGRLPVLDHDGLVIFDSLSIAEYAAEVLAPQIPLWPRDRALKATARSLCAEMHSSFHALRGELPMNLGLRRELNDLTQETRDDLARIFEAWSSALRARDAAGLSGDYLFGSFGIVDAFYLPLATRFRSYGVEIPTDSLRKYQAALLNHETFLEWQNAAEHENLPIKKYDQAGL